MFQSSLARKPDLETVPSLSELTADYGQLDSDEVLHAWREIQKINYAPIFNVAYNLVETLAADDKLVGEILSVLRDTARELEKMGLAQEHEARGYRVPETHRQSQNSQGELYPSRILGTPLCPLHYQNSTAIQRN